MPWIFVVIENVTNKFNVGTDNGTDGTNKYEIGTNGTIPGTIPGTIRNNKRNNKKIYSRGK